MAIKQTVAGVAGVSEMRIELLRAEHVAAMAELLGVTFSQYDPPAKAVGQSQQEIAEMVRLLGPKAIAEGLTMLAFSPNGEMLGAILTDDFACPPPQELATASAAFAPIGAVLDALDDEYRLGKQIAAGQIAHVFMIGVAPHAHGLGIAQTLLRATLANATARGYRTALAEATGAASQHLLAKIGFRAIQQIPYQSFVFQGNTPFASITEVPSVVLMEWRDAVTSELA